MVIRRRIAALPIVLAAALVAATGCATSSRNNFRAQGDSAGQVISAVASIDAWGSVLAQLGGTHVRSTSIIRNPDADPHAYEPTPADSRAVSDASVFVENGVGYDAWADRLLAANPAPGRAEVNVGRLAGVPAGGNPHRWYSPADVETAADAITAALTKAAPSDAAYFTAQRRAFETSGLAGYHQLISQISGKYAGTPIGASESIVAPLAEALGLNLITPPAFLKAISEGTDPSAADKAAVDSQITHKLVAVYVFNSQNSTPDVAAQVRAAKSQGIPVVAVTETLSPQGASFQDWQCSQLRGLAAALAKATGK